MKFILILAGMQPSNIVAVEAQKTPTHPKQVTICCGYWSRGIVGIGRIVPSNKKRNLRKYSIVFLKHFPKKKKLFGEPCI